MKNYLTYPCKTMSITQGYVGNYSHEPHTTGTPKDYPWDEACGTTARSPMYCPCDEMVIKRIYTSGANTIWLESTTKVNLADGSYDYVTLMVTHPNDSDIKKLSKGQEFKRGDLICHEGGRLSLQMFIPTSGDDEAISGPGGLKSLPPDPNHKPQHAN